MDETGRKYKFLSDRVYIIVLPAHGDEWKRRVFVDIGIHKYNIYMRKRLAKVSGFGWARGEGTKIVSPLTKGSRGKLLSATTVVRLRSP